MDKWMNGVRGFKIQAKSYFVHDLLVVEISLSLNFLFMAPAMKSTAWMYGRALESTWEGPASKSLGAWAGWLKAASQGLCDSS